MKLDNAISKKLIKHLQSNNVIITPSITLQITLLDNAISDYKMAKEDILTNGIKTLNNNGKTIGLNPSVKAKLDNARLIIKLLKEMGLSNTDNEEIDDFIKSLTE